MQTGTSTFNIAHSIHLNPSPSTTPPTSTTSKKHTRDSPHKPHLNASSPTLKPSSPKPPRAPPLQTLYSGPSSLHPSYPCPHPQSTLYPSPTQTTPQPPKNRKTCSKKPYHHHPTSTHPHSGTPNTHRRRCSRSGEPTWMREHQEITNVPNTRRRTDGDARGCVATR